jgi:hypothetical protein
MSLKGQRRSSASALLSEKNRTMANSNFLRAAHVLHINVCGSTSGMAASDQESLEGPSTQVITVEQARVRRNRCDGDRQVAGRFARVI